MRERIKPFWIATVEDLITALGLKTTRELSDLEQPKRETINRKRLHQALDLAENTILAMEVKAPDAGKLSMRINFKRFQIDIARYYLDSEKNKTFTRERYEDALEQIKHYCDLDPRTPYDEGMLKKYGLRVVRRNRVFMSSNKPVRVFTRKGTIQYREGRLFDSSQSSRTDENPDILVDEYYYP